MKTYNYIFILLLCLIPFMTMCASDNDPEPTPEPGPRPDITEYIVSAEIVNKKGAEITFDNGTRTIIVKIPRYLDKTNVQINLSLNDGVSVTYPQGEKIIFDFTAATPKLWLDVNGNTIIFNIKYEDIIGKDSAIGKVDIRDMVLIYNGGAHRSVVWNEKMFEPYISIEGKEKGEKRWLFDGFLFLEIHNGTRGFASGYKPLPARKTEWIGLMNGYLKEGRSLRALNDCIEKVKPNAPDHGKRKIVMSLPEPIPNQKDWGDLNGKPMDFSKTDDRINVVKWYIDFLIKEFKKAELENLQLAGFYWLAEEATNTRTILKQISEYIKGKGMKFYWIPYFNTDGWKEWKELGFDKAYLQPNHFFTPGIPDSRIDEACKRAKDWGMDMEFEFDDRALTTGGWSNKFYAYLNGFKKNGVFENNDIAYYEGGDGFYKLKNGKAEDQILYNDLADIIAGRQEKFYSK